MHQMYRDGDETALASSIRSLIGVTSEDAKELEALTGTSPPTSKEMAKHDAGTDPAVFDTLLVEYFNPSHLPMFVEQLQRHGARTRTLPMTMSPHRPHHDITVVAVSSPSPSAVNSV